MFTSRAMSWDKIAKTVMKSIHDKELHWHVYFPSLTPFLNCTKNSSYFLFMETVKSLRYINV